MNAAVAHVLIAPPSPALVHRLSPHDPAGHAIRAAMDYVCAELSSAHSDAAQSEELCFDVVAKQHQDAFTAHTGSFRAWGDPLTDVQEGNYLPELIARYLCANHGRVRGVHEKLQPLQSNSVTLCMLNGSHGLTSRAPAMLLPGARQQHREIMRFLSGTRQVLPEATQDDSLLEDADLWHALQQLHPIKQRLLVADASLGVGRYFAYWQVAAPAA